MRVKLIQSGIVDSADAVQRLDFSGLTAAKGWSVAVNYGGDDQVIARVNWEPSAAYEACVYRNGSPTDPERINSHSHIVTVVMCLLIRLFRAEEISDLYQRQPVVAVAPISA